MIKLSKCVMTLVEAILSNYCTVTSTIRTKVIEPGRCILNVFCHCKQNITHLKYLLLNEIFIINSKTLISGYTHKCKFFLVLTCRTRSLSKHFEYISHVPNTPVTVYVRTHRYYLPDNITRNITTHTRKYM